jgi:mono/diheme cytochrome c family protein
VSSDAFSGKAEQMVLIRRAAALVLVWPLLVACGGGGGSSAEETPTPIFSESPSSASASPTAEPSPSDSSGEVEEDYPETPEAVARAFVAGVGKAINTGNTEHFLKYATKRCQTCHGVAANIDKSYRGGKSAESAGWTLATMDVQERTRTRTIFKGILDTGSQRLFDSDGAVYDSDPAQSFRYQLQVDRLGKRLAITGWDLGR